MKKFTSPNVQFADNAQYPVNIKYTYTILRFQEIPFVIKNKSIGTTIHATIANSMIRADKVLSNLISKIVCSPAQTYSNASNVNPPKIIPGKYSPEGDNAADIPIGRNKKFEKIPIKAKNIANTKIIFSFFRILYQN